MNKMRWMTGSLIVLGLLTGGIASAQPYRPGQGAPQEQGGLSDEAQPPADDAAPDDRPGQARADDDFSDVVAADQDHAGAASSGRDRRQDDLAEARPSDQEREDAITYCALAARDEAERDGGYAEVRQVQEPRETRNGYDVEGDVEVRSGWRAQDGRSRHFTCSVQNGRIADLYFGRDRAAR